MNKDNFAAVILAAGYSSRMGEFKPLLKFGKYTAIETAVNTFKAAGIYNIIVVVGHRGTEIMRILEKSSAKCVENKNYSQGMYFSVLKGIEKLEKDITGFFILPVDTPLIKKDTIEMLKIKYSQCDKGIIYPSFNGIKGHPPLIGFKYKDVIINANEKGGLKSVLNKFNEDSINVPVFDEATIMDMDTKEEYEKLLKYFNLNSLNRAECYCILNIYNVPNNIIRHCNKVSEVALNILNKLNKEGCNFDSNIMETAALLHDIARKKKNHAKAGEEILKKLGYEHIGNIISTHMDIKVNEKENITENEILYLADKLVKEDRYTTLEQRYSNILLEYDNQFTVLYKIQKRFAEAKKIIKKIENIIGKSFNYE